MLSEFEESQEIGSTYMIGMDTAGGRTKAVRGLSAIAWYSRIYELTRKLEDGIRENSSSGLSGLRYVARVVIGAGGQLFSDAIPIIAGLVLLQWLQSAHVIPRHVRVHIL